MPESLEMSEPIFQPRRIGHVNLIVDDLDRSTNFYNEVCGLALEFREVGLKANFFGTGNTPHDVGMIECSHGKDRYGRDGHLQIPAAVAARVSLNHIAWEMENEAELVAGFGRAKNAGVEIARMADHQVAHSIYIRDPDGNLVEFYADTVKNWRDVLQGDVDLVTSRWDPEAEKPSREPHYDPAPEIRRVPNAAFHPHRLTHVVLTTRNIAPMRRFYEDIGGLSPVFAAADGSLALLVGRHAGYRYHLAVVAGDQPGLHHFSLELANGASFAAAEAEAVRKGCVIERRVDGPLKRGTFLTDPDGFRVEFYCKGVDDYSALDTAEPIMKPFLV
jgi:catechol 2,3-dioxygenase